jgi:hypothetical protein
VRDKLERSFSSPSSLRQLERERDGVRSTFPIAFFLCLFPSFSKKDDDDEDDDRVAVKRKVSSKIVGGLLRVWIFFSFSSSQSQEL